MKTTPRAATPLVLVLLACLAIFSMPLTAAAAATQPILGVAFFFQQASNEDVGDNGRTPEQIAKRGPILPEVPMQGRPDVWRGSDRDDGKRRRRGGVQGQTSSAVFDSLGVQPLSALYGNLALQVAPNAPLHSFQIAPDGNVGLGTGTPRGRLHVVAHPDAGTTSDLLLLDGNGNLEIGGLLTEASSALLKENFSPVVPQDVLQRLSGLMVSTWNYKTDAPSIRHMGPMAQDFYAAFGLGRDAEHIAPLDANGVAFAAIQALTQQLEAQATRITTLEQQNAMLLQRLEALEAVLQREEEP